MRLSIIDHETYLIIKDILVEKDKFNKDYIEKFLNTSLDGLPLECIITDGLTAYNSIIDKMGAKHQSCIFHIMQTLMKPYNRRISTINKIIESLENQIEKKINKITKLEKEYPYKQGRTPKSDKKACDNVKDRKKLKREKSELIEKLSKYTTEKRDLGHYLEEVKKIFDKKTLQGGINKLNKLLNKKDEIPELIYDFLKKLSKKNR